MRRTTMSAARIAVGAVSALGFALVAGTGTAQAAPQDCAITRDVFGAQAVCHDTGAPAGREYTLVVECTGLHMIPDAFPLMAIGPYRGSWGGWFAPDGHGSATCLEPTSFGIATGAHVEIYRQ